MEFITILTVSLAVAAVFYQLGLAVGENRGEKNERFSWKEGLLPIKIDEALREAFHRIELVLWHLRDELHNLPQEGGSLPPEEAYFIHKVYCRIPSGIESIITKSQNLPDRLFMDAKAQNVLVEKYAGRVYFGDQELKPSDFDLAEQGDYTAAIFIARAILSENSLYQTATV